jgi:hypothetical protein
MPTTVYSKQATIPAGTPASALVTVDISILPVTVNRIDIRVPPGPSGLMSFALFAGGGQALPIEYGTYFTWDDVDRSFPIDGLPDGGVWEIVGYNTDIYDHTVYVDFLTTPNAMASTTAADTAVSDTTAQLLGLSGG